VSDDVRDAYPEPDDTAPQDDHEHDHLDDGQDRFGDDDGDAGEPGADDAQDVPDLSAAAPAVEIEHTGNPVVDSVLDSLRELDQLPVSEHVAVFEAAHDRLRGALADAGDPPADS
jgi:hypothetical protein